jgi:hypothetical protein
MTWADERGERLPLWCDKVLLSSSIGSDQNLHFWIVLERLLHVRSVFASYAAMNRDNRFLSSEKGRNTLFEITQVSRCSVKITNFWLGDEIGATDGWFLYGAGGS